MSHWRPIVALALAVYLGFIVYHAVTPSSWSADLQTPPGAPAKTVNYTCGPLWGSGYVHGPGVMRYPPQKPLPCTQRHPDEIMVAIAVALGAAGLVVIAAFAARRAPTPAV